MKIDKLSATGRNKNIKNQIIYSLCLKLAGTLLGFIIIPKTLNILGTTQYSIWLVILSISNWIVTFDVGIGNGLRNRLTESLSLANVELSCKLISTAYIILSLVGLSMIVVISIAIPFINWQSVFNTTIMSNTELMKIMYFFLVPIILNFILSLINQLFNAFQLSSFTSIISIIQGVLFLSFLFVLKNFNNNLLSIVILYSLCLLISSIIVTVIFFIYYPNYIPKFKWFDKKLVKNILSLGTQFFVIQISTIFMFAITEMIILQLLKPLDVTVYNVTYKLFSFVIIIWSIFLGPYWSAFTEATVKKDFQWIKKTVKKLNKIFILLVFITAILVLSTQLILNMWVGKSKIVPGLLVTAFMGLNSLLLCWSNIYSFYLNGIGKVKVQTIIAVIQAIAVIPLCLLFTKVLQLGLSGVVLALIVCLLPFSIIGPILSYKSFKEQKS